MFFLSKNDELSDCRCICGSNILEFGVLVDPKRHFYTMWTCHVESLVMTSSFTATVGVSFTF